MPQLRRFLLVLDQVLDTLEFRVAAAEEHRVAHFLRPQPLELAKVEQHFLPTGHLIQVLSAQRRDDGRAVLLGDCVGVVGGDEPARPGHVLDNDFGLPGDILAHVPREQPGPPVVKPARRAADQYADGLAFIEVLGRGLTREAHEQETRQQQHKNSSTDRSLCHCTPPVFGTQCLRLACLAHVYAPGYSIPSQRKTCPSGNGSSSVRSNTT